MCGWCTRSCSCCGWQVLPEVAPVNGSIVGDAAQATRVLAGKRVLVLEEGGGQAADWAAKQAARPPAAAPCSFKDLVCISADMLRSLAVLGLVVEIPEAVESREFRRVGERPYVHSVVLSIDSGASSFMFMPFASSLASRACTQPRVTPTQNTVFLQEDSSASTL